MRVNCNFRDDFGDYDILAEVSHTGMVSIISVNDEYDNDIDLTDFSEEERNQMGFLAKRAAEDLDNMPDEDNDDDNDQDY